MDKVDHRRVLEGSGSILRRTICEGNMDKVDHLRVRQFERVLFPRGPFATIWKHGQSGKLEGSTILRRTICEGNMDKVDHLRVRQFGVAFARETWTKWTT